MSSAACFRFFVYPYISNILGLNSEKPIKAILKRDFVKKKNFTRFAKSKLNTTNNGKIEVEVLKGQESFRICLLYTSPSPRDGLLSRMPSSA